MVQNTRQVVRSKGERSLLWATHPVMWEKVAMKGLKPLYSASMGFLLHSGHSKEKKKVLSVFKTLRWVTQCGTQNLFGRT